MADKIKKFFKKKKLEAKFKTAGPGYKLDGSSQAFQGPKKQSDYKPIARSGLTDESRQAAAAAIARLGGPKPDTAAFNTSLAAIQAQVKREIEAEKKRALSTSSIQSSQSESEVESRPTHNVENSPLLAVQGVYFRCSLVSQEILSRDEWNNKIKTFLYEQLEEEKGLTACLIIHTLNKNKEKIEACVETLCKYLENILANPDEEKFKKIRTSNRIFQEKVAPLEGTKELLEAAGFEIKKLPVNDTEEEFYVFNENNLSEGPDTLEILIDALRNAEPVTLELDRNLQVLLPSQAVTRNELPSAFFNVTPEELKKEQQLRTETVERSLMLRTKVMREKEELREMKKYRFSVIRIRFPDGIMLQGTFNVYEKFHSVLDYVRENIYNEEAKFILSTPTNQRLTTEDGDNSLLELRLVPAIILIFVLLDDEQPEMYLKPEVMILASSFNISS